MESVLLDSTPPIADFHIYKGDTFVRTFRVKQRSTRQLLDLTGATATMVLKDPEDNQTLLYTFTTTIDTALSTITASIPSWSGLTWTQGVYDLQVTYAGGVVETLCRGTITVEGDVS